MRVILIAILSVLAWATMLCFVAAALTSCSSTSGWRVSFGVSPVAAITETQQTADRRK